MLEIHWRTVVLHHHHLHKLKKNLEIHADLHLVDQMRNVQIEMAWDPVPAFQNTLEIPTSLVNQNARLIKIVTGQKLVFETSVKIHAQEYAELMQDVKFKIISQFVYVLMVTKEMHLLNVDLDHHHQKSNQ